MSTTYAEPTPSASVPHIGPAHHLRRNAWFALGVFAISISVLGYSVYWRQHNAVAADRLTQFQALYAERCDTESFSSTDAALAKKLYLGSSLLEREVDQQYAALRSGASCEEVWKALRAVDFPLPSAVAPSPRAVTINFDEP